MIIYRILHAQALRYMGNITVTVLLRKATELGRAYNQLWRDFFNKDTLHEEHPFQIEGE